jgi:hypothetical protein
MTLTKTTITAEFQNVLGDPAQTSAIVATWQVTVTPTAALTDYVDDVFVLPIPIPIPLQPDGSMNTAVYSTDNANLLDPGGLSGQWKYVFRLDMGEDYSVERTIALPYSATPVDLTDLFMADPIS